MADDKLTPRAFLYLGVYTTAKGVRCHGYYDCGPNPGFTVPDKPVRPSRLFPKPLFRWGRIGSVYAVDANETVAGRITGQAKYLDELTPDLRRAAETRHETEEQVHQNKLQAKKLAAKRLSVDDFKAWREEYATCNRDGRAAILARIYSYLEEGRSLFGN